MKAHLRERSAQDFADADGHEPRRPNRFCRDVTERKRILNAIFSAARPAGTHIEIGRGY